MAALTAPAPMVTRPGHAPPPGSSEKANRAMP